MPDALQPLQVSESEDNTLLQPTQKLDAYKTKAKDAFQTYTDWKQKPTDQNFQAVMKHIDPVISSALITYAGGNQSLKTRATILAVNALGTYDSTKGASLKTHVYNSLQPLRRYSAERFSVVHIPENVRLNQAHLRKFSDDFKEKNLRDPNHTEIGDALGLTPRQIAKVQALSGEVSESSMLNEKGDSKAQGAPRDYYEVWRDYVYHDLDDTNKKVFEWSTGYNKSPVLQKKEIAQRLGISAAAVSQRINTIVKKLESGNQ